MFVLLPVSNSGTPGVAEQSSSLVIMMIAQIGVGTQEALVLCGRRAPIGAERAQDGGELVLEAAATLAEGGDAGEHVLQVAGVVPGAEDVRNICRAGLQPGRRAGATRGVLKDALLAARRAAARDGAVPRAHVRRYDRDMNVGQTQGRAPQPGHERRKAAFEVGLRQPHRRRVVDQEEEIEVAVRNHDTATRAAPPRARAAHTNAAAHTNPAAQYQRCRRAPPRPAPPPPVPPSPSSVPRPQRTPAASGASAASSTNIRDIVCLAIVIAAAGPTIAQPRPREPRPQRLITRVRA